ncbi:phospholipase a2 [Podospora conica]|nr:phospholipase a2 [Schizothecium conicum]
MKFGTLLLATAGTALALPTLPPRADAAVTITDQIMYSITLPAFTTRRNARNPATLDWTSDDCTSSPDNPLGFPFKPACHRHDFGYRNYRDQSRFTTANKKKIDDNFKKDLYYQCSSSSVGWLCRALADVYYAAVRAFGGNDATKRAADDVLVHEYEEKLAIYEQLVKEAMEAGLKLPGAAA